MIEAGDESILIFVPHADDETLGCGGLIEKACRCGNDVNVVLAASGNTFFYHSNQTVSTETRQREFADALRWLGCTSYDVMYDDKEAQLDTVPKAELVARIDRYLADVKPTMVFVPYPSFHQDHQALFQACMAGLRPTPKSSIRLIAMYEYPFIVWQYPRLHDTGELYLDISSTIDKKLEALGKHVSQLREDGHMISPGTVKQWAQMRGMEIGVAYAEKYHLLRSRLV